MSDKDLVVGSINFSSCTIPEEESDKLQFHQGDIASSITIVDDKITVSESVLFWAFRYCLGRQSYAVSDCASAILENWDKLPDSTKDLMVKEINEAIKEERIGMECDYLTWQKIVERREQDLSI